MKKPTYQQTKAELEAILESFETEQLEIEEALQKHARAEELLASMEDYLKSAEAKIKKK